MKSDNISFIKTKYQKRNLILGLTFAVIMVTLLSASECQAVTLTITANNGSVTATPAKADYTAGEVVELRPKPDTGYYFAGWAGDARGQRLVLNLTMDSDKAITAHFDVWQPPIGIPMPEFGIFETHYMYEGQMYDFGSGPEPYKDAGNGPYTHYVDNTHPSATDSGNTYGSASKPRDTIPRDLPAGSVVEVHGGPYTYINGGDKTLIEGMGSESQPVFVRGVNTPQWGVTLNLAGSYMIFEGFYSYNRGISIRKAGSEVPIHHMAIRDCEIGGDGTTTGGGGLSTGGLETNYVVFYNNHVHRYGQYDYDGENDRMGTVAGKNSHYIWVVDNHIHHNGGDSFQAGHSAPVGSITHIYIGRNDMHDDGEEAIDLKCITDVIVSQNKLHDYYILNPSSGGTLTVSHYGGISPGPTRAWFIFNEMYNAEKAANGVTSGTEDIYFIGNIIHDIQGSAFRGWSHDDVYYVGNTMYNVGTGIDDEGLADAKATIVNNIFGSLNDPETGYHIKMDYAAYRNNAIVSNNLFQDPMNVNTVSVNYIEADPSFVDAANVYFHLQSTSPAIDAGTSSGVVKDVFDRFEQLYGIDIRKDIEGKPRTGAWDIGAYEYVLNAVSDLAASGTSQNSVTFSWSMPSDDGLAGKPSRYDIRYATSLITEANWDTATQVQGEPVPGDFGVSQSFTITGLNPGTKYYFAILAVLYDNGFESRHKILFCDQDKQRDWKHYFAVV